MTTKDKLNSPEKFYVIKEAASLLGLPYHLLQRAVRRGLVPCHTLGNSRKYVRLSEVIAVIDNLDWEGRMYRRICPQCGEILSARDHRRRSYLDDLAEYQAPPTTAVGGVIPNSLEEAARTPTAEFQLRLPFLKEDDDD